MLPFIFCNIYQISLLLLLLLLLLLYECETRGMHKGDKRIAYKISGGKPGG